MASRSLVTPIEPEPDPPRPEPTLLVLFNDRQGPAQVTDIVSVRHSFVETEVWETTDEGGRPAWLLAMWCETATAEGLFDLVGSRLPDYIQARRFPPSRLARVREDGTQVA
ncbi:MAG: hypothetical protein JWM98_1298 [Thermoleophilia bacterium]|nr:hypothetical protein [Thermoleophilia bacterium]